MLACDPTATQDGGMEIQTRKIVEGELEDAMRTCEVAFGADIPDAEMASAKQVVEAERTFVATEGDVFVGAGSNYTFELSVPGGKVPAAGLTFVGVMPSHRRRGVLTGLMRHFLADPLEHGEPVSILWASESAIYQRYGYGQASGHMQIEIERALVGFPQEPPSVCRVRLIDVDEAVRVLPTVYDAVFAQRPGMNSRTEAWWRHHRLRDHESHRDGGGPMWRAVLERDGRAVGYALYRAHLEWPHGVPRGKLDVIEAMAIDPDATRETWRFILGVDLIETVRAHFMPVDLPLPMMVADPRRVLRRVSDNLWLRIVDVPKALAARGYRTADRITFEVEDHSLEANSGTWLVDTLGDDVSVSAVDDRPQLRFGMRDLGAIYLGGTSLHSLAQAGRVEELEPGALERADAMFMSSVAPWCPEIF